MRMMAGRGRPGIPYNERHGDGEGETGEERRHEDDGRQRETLLFTLVPLLSLVDYRVSHLKCSFYVLSPVFSVLPRFLLNIPDKNF